MTAAHPRLAEEAERYAWGGGAADGSSAGAEAFPESTAAEWTAAESTAAESTLAESTLTALWLLGRVPERVLERALPFRLLRPGRAGRGPGPDVRETAFLAPSGATLAGDVEVHLRASDFVRHGHAADPAYAGVVLHLCWVDDRPDAGSATPLPLPALAASAGSPGTARSAPTVALSAWMTAAEVERLVALGPDAARARPDCAEEAARVGPAGTAARVRDEGRRRLAERTWRAWRLADRYGFDGALRMLLERAVASSAGRARESSEQRAAAVDGVLRRLGGAGPAGTDPVEALARAALGGRAVLVAAVRAAGMGEARSAEVAWNAALPLVAALAAAYDDAPLARATAALAEGWPAPRPYGRTRALAAALDEASPARDASSSGGPGDVPAGGASRPARGALYAQGLLHLQDLWCARGGCGACPLSGDAPEGRAS